jgi:hypothetical protein
LFLFFKKESAFFFEKKKQKTFDCFDLAYAATARLCAVAALRVLPLHAHGNTHAAADT